MHKKVLAQARMMELEQVHKLGLARMKVLEQGHMMELGRTRELVHSLVYVALSMLVWLARYQKEKYLNFKVWLNI